MSGEKSNSIVSFGDLGKPADTLIKKVSEGMGGAFKPFQIKRVAKAEAEAALTKAKADIEITELQRRAMHRFVEEESNKQENMEQITAQALPLLEANSKPDEIENDWITNFFDKCRIISDQEMQALWSRVLSGEANAPGTFSKRTVNFLSNIDKSEAMLFLKLCGFNWQIDGDTVPIIYEFNNDYYKENGISFDMLHHLKSIGLIHFGVLEGFGIGELPKLLTVFYYGEPVAIELPDNEANLIDVGSVLLTKIGEELARICDSKPVDGFKEYVLEKWRAKKYIKDESSEQDAGELPASGAVDI